MPNAPRSRSAHLRRRQQQSQPPQKPKTAPAGGFGSYLKGILPDDLAVAAGAFSMTMLQVRNIQKAEFEKFAQITASIEVTNKGLPKVNGTDVPVNIPKAQEDRTILALGSGPDGTYTTSDVVGCMSGLPYSWGEILRGIKEAQTEKLKNIYQENFLAVTWEAAEVSPTVILETREVEISPGPPPVYQTEYRCAGFIIDNKGGGYGRGGASGPIITADNGGTGVGVVGTNPSEAASLGGGTYGRIIGAVLTNPGAWVLAPPTAISIQAPPTATLAVQPNGNKSTGGTNTSSGTSGWPNMNNVVQDYVNQGVSEVNYIAATKPQVVSDLNVVYDQAGTQLEIEQRARYSAIAPVPIPRSLWVTHYPLTTSTFVDAVASYAPQTLPHMYAQTLEAISNLSTVGGQSLVAMLRAERNAERLWKLNTPSENFVPGELKDEIVAVLNGNGTVPTAKEGLKVRGINGNPNNPVTIYTPPALLAQYTGDDIGTVPAGSLITPKPFGYFNPNNNKYYVTNKTVSTAEPGSSGPYKRITRLNNAVSNNINLLGPAKDGTGPARPIKKSLVDPASIQSGTNVTSPKQVTVGTNPLLAQLGITLPNQTSLPAQPGTNIPDPNGIQPGINVPAGAPNPNVIELEPIVVVTTGLEVPEGLGSPLDIGEPEYPGSLARSNAIDALPLTLDAPYLSAVLLPNTLTVDEAIDEVIKCNCDCWVD